MGQSWKNERKGNMFGLLQNVLVILLLIGTAYFLLNLMGKRSSPGGKSEKSALEGARDNVDRINAQTRAREDQINDVLKEKNTPRR